MSLNVRIEELQPYIAMIETWSGHRDGFVHCHSVAGRRHLHLRCWRTTHRRFDQRACIGSRRQLGEEQSQQSKPCDKAFGRAVHSVSIAF